MTRQEFDFTVTDQDRAPLENRFCWIVTLENGEKYVSFPFATMAQAKSWLKMKMKMYDNLAEKGVEGISKFATFEIGSLFPHRKK